jgi:vacuolar protein sorting-associated protein 26
VISQATIRVRDGKKLVHEGIKVEFVGSIGELRRSPHNVCLLIVNHLELFYDRGNHYEFLSLSQELAAPGEMRQAQTFDFHFKNVEKQFESYQGINVKLRYVSHPQLRPSYLTQVFIVDMLFVSLSLDDSRM